MHTPLALAAACALAAAILMPTRAHAQASPRYLDYIETYAPLAVQEMYASGIPASITLAQGLLESGAGQSTLARNANNHFGIKCHSGWSGKRAYRKDDDRNAHGKLIESCFRKYDDPAESYADHSDFLTSGARYASLFLLRPGDYKGWARGLKKAGYATSKTYASKLIGIIESYGLDRYDREGPGLMLAGDAAAAKTRADAPVAALTASAGDARPALSRPPSAPAEHSVAAARVRPGEAAAASSSSSSIRPSRAKVDGAILVQNDVKYTLARPGERLGDVARRTRRLSRDLVRYNEAFASATDRADARARIYLQPKRKKYRGRDREHVVRSGETMQAIADRYAIQTEELYKRNRMPMGTEPHRGERIVLRGKRRRGGEVRLAQASGAPRSAPAPVTVGRTPAPTPAPTPPAVVETAPRVSPSAAETPVVAAPARTAPRSVTVNRGDTLWSISRRSGVSVAEIRALNALTGDTIHAGQRLVIGR